MASVLKRDISMNAPVLRGDFTQNVPQLLAIPADPSGEMEELMAWYPYTQILAYWEHVVFPLIESCIKPVPLPAAAFYCSHLFPPSLP